MPETNHLAILKRFEEWEGNCPTAGANREKNEPRPEARGARLPIAACFEGRPSQLA